MDKKQMGVFSKRELDLITNCKVYADNDPAGLPGHNLMVIISKMVDLLQMAMAVVPDESMPTITKAIAQKYSIKDEDRDYSALLFDQILGMFTGRRFVRRDVWGARRTAEEIAASQGRSVIYICPDETIRDGSGEVVAQAGVSLYHTEYADCIPVSFGDVNDFHNWLDTVTEEKQDG